MKSGGQRILAIQLKRVGDLILTLPALDALRAAFPGAAITLAIEQGSQELLPAIPAADHTWIYRRRGSNSRNWLRLATAGFDISLDFTGTDRSALASFLARADRRIGFQQFRRSWVRGLCYNCLVDSPVRDRHTIDHHLDLLRPLGIADPDPAVRLALPAWTAHKAQQILDRHGINPPFFVLHPGTARPEKFWPAGRWAAVADHVGTELGLTAVLTGGPGPAEAAHLAEIKSALHIPHHDLSGQVDLLTLAQLIGQARMFLGVDSAPLHLAGAAGTPAVGLFGPTNPFHWRPRRDDTIILQAGSEDATFRPHHEKAPMSQLSTGRVIRAIDTLAAMNPVPRPEA